MPRILPAHPNLTQYKKQAKDLVSALRIRDTEALDRANRFLPTLSQKAASDALVWKLADAQLILAREHGFPSWPKFATHVITTGLQRSLETLTDPVDAFIRAASVPREGDHGSGTLEEAEMILARYPQVRRASIYTAALMADQEGVHGFLARDPGAARAPGGPYQWDAMTYLCFSRYLRMHRERDEQFVSTARALLEAGADANTGWYETIDHPNPRQIIESAIYAAAGIAHSPELTRLLLGYGADPNDEETPYHAAENYDSAVLKVLLDSGKLNRESVTTLLLRKADWHDFEGMRLLLAHGADPNASTRWGITAFQQALRRDNSLEVIELLLDHGADSAVRTHMGRSGSEVAARRGRSDVLSLLTEQGVDLNLGGVNRLIAAVAQEDRESFNALVESDPHLREQLLEQGGTLLAEFAGNGNTEGIRCLLDSGIQPDALFRAGDGYWDVARDSTALHVAAWRAHPKTVRLLIERGTPVNALDGKGRTALQLAIRACVDSYWKHRRSPESVRALLEAGASRDGIVVPCGYDEVDTLLMAQTDKSIG